MFLVTEASMAEQAIEVAREAALRLLERTRRTRRELERRLGEAGHPRAAIAPALDRLARVGLVDDREVAKAFARAHLGRRASALQTVKRRLMARGISAEDVAEAVAALEREAVDDDVIAHHPGAEGERARALRAAAPLFRRYARLEPRLARTRLIAALARRGFTRSTIAHVLTMAPGPEIPAGDDSAPDSRPSTPRRARPTLAERG